MGHSERQGQSFLIWIAGWLACIGWLACTGSVVAADAPEAALPDSTWFAASTDDFQTLVENWQRTSWGKFFAAEAFQPLRSELRAAREASLLHVQPWLGFDWDMLARFSGPASVAYVTRENRGGWVLMLDAQKNEMLAKECLELAQRYFADSGASKREVKLGENKSITAFEYTPKAKPEKATTGKSPPAVPPGTAVKSTEPSKSKDTKSSSTKAPAASKGGGKTTAPAKAPPREPRNVICLTSQHLLIADSLEALEILLDASAKPNASLANSDLFQQIAKTTAESSQNAPNALRWFLRPLELWAALDSQPKDRRKGERDLLGAMKKQGFRGLKAAGGTVDFPNDDEIRYFGTVVAPPPYKAAMRVLELLPGKLEMPPQWVADDAATIQSANWNYRTAMSALGLLGSELEDPQVPSAFEDTLDGLASSPDTGQVDVRKEIFDKLAKHVVIVSRFSSDRTKKNPLGKQFLWIAAPGVEANADEEAAKKVASGLIDSLTRLLKNEENIVSQTAPNQTLWYSKDDEGGGLLTPNSPVSALLAGQQDIVVSTDREHLKFLAKSREPAKPLVKHPDFQVFREHLDAWQTEQACYAFLNRTGPMLETLIEALRRDEDLSESGMQSTIVRFAILGNSNAALAKKVPAFEQTGVRPQPLAGVAWPHKEIGFTFRGAVLRVPENATAK